MWSDTSLDDIKDITISLRSVSFKPYRIDREHFADTIADQTVSEMCCSRYQLADFAHNPKDSVRGSVYNEAVFARGLNVPYIFAAKEGSDVHFNVNHFFLIEWRDSVDRRTLLTARVRNVPGTASRIAHGGRIVAMDTSFPPVRFGQT